MTKALEDLEPVEIVAMTKALRDVYAVARDQVLPGVHHVDVVVRLKGTVKVADAQLYTPTAEISFMKILAQMLHNIGYNEAAMALRKMFVDQFMTAAEMLIKEKNPKKIEDEIEALSTAFEMVKQRLRDVLPKKLRHGAVSPQLTVETWAPEDPLYSKIKKIFGRC